MESVDYIRPFVESVHELFDTMLHCKPRRVGIRKSEPKISGCDVVGLIGMTGPMRGTVALLLSNATAGAIVTRLLGVEADDSETIIDGVSEIINIIGGSAKAKLNAEGPPTELSLPNVIAGNKSTVLSPSWSTWAEIAYESELGSFCLRVSIEQRKDDE